MRSIVISHGSLSSTTVMTRVAPPFCSVRPGDLSKIYVSNDTDEMKFEREVRKRKRYTPSTEPQTTHLIKHSNGTTHDATSMPVTLNIPQLATSSRLKL